MKATAKQLFLGLCVCLGVASATASWAAEQTGSLLGKPVHALFHSPDEYTITISQAKGAPVITEAAVRYALEHSELLDPTLPEVRRNAFPLIADVRLIHRVRTNEVVRIDLCGGLGLYRESDSFTYFFKYRLPAILGGAASGLPTRQQHLVASPEAAIRGALPDGWKLLKTQKDTSPFYLPNGKGVGYYLGRQWVDDGKPPFAAVLYIMPSEYDDGAADLARDKSRQTWPPRLIATTIEAKLYLWPGREAENWRTMQADLLKALVTSSDPVDAPNIAPLRR